MRFWASVVLFTTIPVEVFCESYVLHKMLGFEHKTNVYSAAHGVQDPESINTGWQ